MVDMGNKKQAPKLLVIRKTPELESNLEKLKTVKKYKFANNSDLVREALSVLVALEVCDAKNK